MQITSADSGLDEKWNETLSLKNKEKYTAPDRSPHASVAG